MSIWGSYLGPWPGCQSVICDFLPRLQFWGSKAGGYVSVGWLFWSVYLEWKFAKR